MTFILAIDTTMGACSVALMKSGDIIGQRMELRARGHVERLIPMIDELCDQTDVEIAHIDQIAVTIGPGTFAGVRIGLSAAKGIGLALDIPIIAITTLEALAFQFAQIEKEFQGKIAVAIDARRGEVYLQRFEIRQGAIKEVSKPEAVPLAYVKDKVGADIALLIGSGIELLRDIGTAVRSGFDHPDAAFIAQMAAQNADRAQLCDHVSPLYLRAPDAKKPAPLKMIVTDE